MLSCHLFIFYFLCAKLFELNAIAEVFICLGWFCASSCWLIKRQTCVPFLLLSCSWYLLSFLFNTCEWVELLLSSECLLSMLCSQYLLSRFHSKLVLNTCCQFQYLLSILDLTTCSQYLLPICALFFRCSSELSSYPFLNTFSQYSLSVLTLNVCSQNLLFLL